ncbi:MAG: glycosyltransferase family 2 protein [Anaerolineae bacterium]|nr:glycosyltransferase family 2 protein [Anaerolineae bacterium]
MKLIIQIPCWNEEDALPLTLADLPRQIAGVDEVEILVIDDGSIDRTVEVAQEAGVDHVVRLREHRGLAAAFAAGLDVSLRLGADIIVNTDADHQYRGRDIERLIQPILTGQADMVVGDRQTDSIPYFSWGKKLLQRIGSWVVRQVSGTHVPDATSGFRAYSREAALALNVISDYTYTLETIIQAGAKGIALAHVPITVNRPIRKSRLVRSILDYCCRSAATILRIYTMYKPLWIFSIFGSVVLMASLALAIRYLYFLFLGEGTGHIQSVVLAGVLLVLGVQMLLIGLVADLVSINRCLNEEVLLRVKKLELAQAQGTTPQRSATEEPSAQESGG